MLQGTHSENNVISSCGILCIPGVFTIQVQMVLVVPILLSVLGQLLFKCNSLHITYYLIKNSRQAVKKGVAPKKAMVKKDVKSKVAAKKWL